MVLHREAAVRGGARAVRGRDTVEITWRSFQLNPDYPVGGREPHDEHLARKLGTTPARSSSSTSGSSALAAAEGLDYHFETYVTV